MVALDGAPASGPCNTKWQTEEYKFQSALTNDTDFFMFVARTHTHARSEIPLEWHSLNAIHLVLLPYTALFISNFERDPALYSRFSTLYREIAAINVEPWCHYRNSILQSAIFQWHSIHITRGKCRKKIHHFETLLLFILERVINLPHEWIKTANFAEKGTVLMCDVVCWLFAFSLKHAKEKKISKNVRSTLDGAPTLSILSQNTIFRSILDPSYIKL